MNVLEPMTQERWDIAMGPTLPMDSCVGYSVLQGPPKRRYEDKYICGWQHGPFRPENGDAKANAFDDIRRDHFLQNGLRGIPAPVASSREECNVVLIGSNDE